MKKLTKATENKIEENNRTISILISRNEDLYLSELTDFERRISTVSNCIEIPNKYVRKKEEFIEIYSLDKITNDYKVLSNIAYLMQYADLTHYFFTRFSIFGQLKKVHYYYEIINIAVILEAVLNELTQRYRDNCSKCSKQKKCKYLINKETKNDLKKLLDRLNELRIIELNQDQIQKIEGLIDLRNKIHLRLMESTINNNDKYTTSMYNKFMTSYKQLIKSINFDRIICFKD